MISRRNLVLVGVFAIVLVVGTLAALNKFPNQPASSEERSPGSTKQHEITLPFNTSNKILRVLSECAGNPTNAQELWETNCVEHKLVIFDPETEISDLVGIIREVTHNGNSGALYTPVALTKDDKHIILNAKMMNPGAGGGSVDYGYAKVSTIPTKSEGRIFIPKEFDFVATRSAHFYDSYGQVAYVDESRNSPACAAPGPTNDGALVVKNIVTSQKKVTEAKNTVYEITGFDEGTSTLTYTATTFTPVNGACLQNINPRESAKPETTTQTTSLL